MLQGHCHGPDIQIFIYYFLGGSLGFNGEFCQTQKIFTYLENLANEQVKVCNFNLVFKLIILLKSSGPVVYTNQTNLLLKKDR